MIIEIDNILDFINKEIVAINKFNILKKKIIHFKLEEYNTIIKYSVSLIIILGLIIYLYYYLKNRNKNFIRNYYDLLRFVFLVPYSIFLIIYVFEIYSFNFWEIIYKELNSIIPD
tara:strand:- start:627 stop:971 length:345 start_codon:yes stop_codon:yes gene_type:complete